MRIYYFGELVADTNETKTTSQKQQFGAQHSVFKQNTERAVPSPYKPRPRMQILLVRDFSHA